MKVIGFMAQSSRNCGPVGYIYHLSSKKPIGPSKGEVSPVQGTKLVVYDTKEMRDAIQFRFVRVKEFGHFGYIEHMGSNKVVHPNEDNSNLVLRDEKNIDALFTFDLERYMIVHRNGRYWHIKGNNPTPKKDTACLLHKPDSNDADVAKFFFGKIDAHHLYPYSSPNISHDWKLLQAFIMPKAHRTFELNYKVGRTKEVSKSSTHAWKISAELVCKFLKGTVGYDGSISSAETSTLTEEKNVKLTIEVPEHRTVCVWQYVYCIAEYGDEIIFLSNIICDTDSLDKKPDMLKHSLDKDVQCNL